MSRRRALYLAVMPAYRQACVDVMLAEIPDLEIYCSEAHLDRSVTTGIRPDQYRPVAMIRLLGRAFVQTGSLGRAIGADDLVVDLNPRSLSAWLLLLARAPLRRRRTLVWGHLHPQAGTRARTGGLRRAMRKLANGTVTYTYADRSSAENELEGQPVWVAPNSLYRREVLEAPTPPGKERTDVIYVGRLEPAKKVGLLIEAFACSGLAAKGGRCVVVGSGREEERLRAFARERGVVENVVFVGWVAEPARLAEFYANSFVSASPGFAGLGLTQSLGFGVPMIVARDEPHSPEIELARTGAVHWAASDDPEALAVELVAAWGRRGELPVYGVRETVVREYSAEAMAAGLIGALTDSQPVPAYPGS